MPTIADFSEKFGLVLKALNVSRGQVARVVGIDKSVVSRWASGVQVPTDHNLTLLTEAIAARRPGFTRGHWERDVEAFQAVFVDEVPAAIAVPAEPTEKPSIAVLPFINMGGDVEQDYFADGITEDIITALSRWRSFRVIARNSTFIYKGRAVDVREIGRDLGVRYVLEGSVRRAGGRIRITAQLVETRGANHVWAERYDRELSDVFAVQDEISQRIAAVVEPEVGRHEQVVAAARPPASLEAWDCLNRGLYLLYKRTRDDNLAARRHFERAIELDPKLSRAHTSLAYTYQLDVLHHFTDDREIAIERHIAHAQRGVQLDEHDSYAHLILAFGYRWARQHALTLAEARKAVACNPNDAWSIGMLGLALDLDGQHREGARLLMQAFTLTTHDPRRKLYPCLIARAYLSAGDLVEAERWARRFLEDDPKEPRAYPLLASVLAHAGQLDEARAAAVAAERLHPGYAAHWSGAREYREEARNDYFIEGLRLAGLDL